MTVSGGAIGPWPAWMSQVRSGAPDASAPAARYRARHVGQPRVDRVVESHVVGGPLAVVGDLYRVGEGIAGLRGGVVDALRDDDVRLPYGDRVAVRVLVGTALAVFPREGRRVVEDVAVLNVLAAGGVRVIHPDVDGQCKDDGACAVFVDVVADDPTSRRCPVRLWAESGGAGGRRQSITVRPSGMVSVTSALKMVVFAGTSTETV